MQPVDSLEADPQPLLVPGTHAFSRAGHRFLICWESALQRMALKIRSFRLADYTQVKSLWKKSGLRSSLGDDRAHIRVKLTRD